ncbi:MAG: BrnT family toxin [Caulobacteraceae bacterium]
MEFEFDLVKSRSNREKHGIDFTEAQKLGNDPDLLEAPARLSGEARFVVIGKIGNRHWTAVTTHRGDRIRLISVRRSRKEEVQRYENG